MDVAEVILNKLKLYLNDSDYYIQQCAREALNEFVDYFEVKAVDIAAYILKRTGPLTAIKLEAMVYYCQAWSLVWDNKALFKEKVEAWSCRPCIGNLEK